MTVLNCLRAALFAEQASGCSKTPVSNRKLREGLVKPSMTRWHFCGKPKFQNIQKHKNFPRQATPHIFGNGCCWLWTGFIRKMKFTPTGKTRRNLWTVCMYVCVHACKYLCHAENNHCNLRCRNPSKKCQGDRVHHHLMLHLLLRGFELSTGSGSKGIWPPESSGNAGHVCPNLNSHKSS